LQINHENLFKQANFMLNHSEMTYANVLSDTWSSLREGVKHGVHPFHTPVLATVFGQDPDIRTVVLRHAHEKQRQLICHTDVRSPKVSMMQKNHRVAWLFYDREAKVQLRLYGEVSVHSADTIAAAHWENCTQSSRRCYLAPGAPGVVLAGHGERSSDANEGFDNFAVISCEVSAIDWLFLRASGHLRARFDWNNDHWDGKWVAP
jgi:pyridoxamine 5'-phosphate oxidase